MWIFRSPISFMAGLIWRFCEFWGICCPYAPFVFGLMIGAKPKKKGKKPTETIPPTAG